MMQITPSISVPVPANETCYLNRCVELIPENSTSSNKTYDGLGVELSSTILADGYHQIVQHGGSQTGFKTHFRLNRKNKNGIVVYVAGNDEWTKDGKTWGSAKLKSEIVDAFKKFYE